MKLPVLRPPGVKLQGDSDLVSLLHQLITLTYVDYIKYPVLKRRILRQGNYAGAPAEAPAGAPRWEISNLRHHQGPLSQQGPLVQQSPLFQQSMVANLCQLRLAKIESKFRQIGPNSVFYSINH